MMLRSGVSGFWALGLWLAAGTAGAADPLAGFPVRLEGQVDGQGPLGVDLNGDGRLELVAATRGQLTALDAAGRPLPGFPVGLSRAQAVATPLAAGPWGGGRPVLVWGTPDGGLMALEADGTPRAGFPLALGQLQAAPSLGDVDGDGRAEVLFGTRDGKLYALGPDGRPLPGFPRPVGAPVSTAISLGRFEPRGELLLVFGDEQGRVHAFRAEGGQAPGFPYEAGYAVTSQPVLGDIDDDGRFELVFGAMDFGIHAVSAEGKPLAGFPIKTGYRIYAACALADLDGDGVVDVLAASSDGKLYAVDGRGRLLKGFPVTIGSRPRSAPVVGDLDADGRPEIAVGSDQNRLHVLRADGQRYPGFPVGLPERVDGAPVLVDLAGGGHEQVAVLTQNGHLFVYRFLRKAKTPPAAIWPAVGRDAARSGRTYPNPPRYVGLGLSPERPTTRDALRLGYRFFDLDGEPEPATRIRWFRDGVHQKALDGQRELPATATAKHQRWRFELQADEGERVFQGPSVEIANTPPGAPEVRLGPRPARTADELVLEVSRPSEDPDGDRIQYKVTWLKDRAPVARLAGLRVPAKLTAKGQRWTAVVTPHDGEADGPPASASLEVANTPPGAARVRLVPETPAVTQPVELRVEKPGRDADGDEVRYLVRWSLGDRVLEVAEDALVLPAGFAPKGSELKAEVTAWDGQERGGLSEARARVRNTPPSAPRMAVHPERPRTRDELRAAVVAGAEDPDLDPVELRLTWVRKGAPGGAPAANEQAGQVRLPASATRKGEVWQLRATPWDGEVAGQIGQAEVTVGNTPPDRPAAEPEEPRPRSDQDLVVRLAAPPGDPDGDRVRLEVVWLEDGRELLRGGPEALRLPAARTRKHGRYLARITPSDGQEAGPAAEVWFEVQNSPPGDCQVVLSPARPHAAEPLRVEPRRPVEDRDGDPVRMLYRWYRDGEPVGWEGPPEQVPAALVRAGQHWLVIARATDGEASGPDCRAELVVENRAPAAPTPRIEPARPRATDGLKLGFAAPPADPDGDAVELEVRWSVDGRPCPAGKDARAVPVGLLRKGQRWAVEVVARDAQLASPPGRAEVVVENSPPEAPAVAILPASPVSTDDLSCRLTRAIRDPDGDLAVPAFVWHLVEDTSAAVPAGPPRHEGDLLPHGLSARGQRWVCVARGSDGSLVGEAGQASVRIGNSPPGAPRVELQPEHPGAADELRCAILEPARDPDGDGLRYKVSWTRDGVVQPFAAETEVVPARLTKARDIWQCSVVASDGELDGPAAASQAVLVR